MSTKLLLSCFVSFFDMHKEYKNCLTLFSSFWELFPAFNWAKEVGNLLSIWFGIKIFNPFPSVVDSSPSKSVIFVVSISSFSSDSSSDSFPTLNPSMYGKIPLLNALIMFSLAKNNYLQTLKYHLFHLALLDFLDFSRYLAWLLVFVTLADYLLLPIV